MNWVFDTETDRAGEFRLGVLMDVRTLEPQTFRDPSAMRAALQSLPKGAVVWGHNVQYDLLVLWKGSVGAWFVNGRFRRAALGGIQFRDTLSFFELPLADAAKLVGSKKTGEGGASFEYSDSRLAEYCADDCRATAALVRSILRFASEVGVSKTATGPGSWAREYWKQAVPTIAIYPDDRRFRMPRGLIRGGLVKWQSGTITDGEKWDVKSAYPWRMWADTFPDVQTVGRFGVPFLVESCGVWYTVEEADLLGLRPVKVLRCPATRWGRPFRPFVERLMDLRNRYKRASDGAGDYLSKRVLNSLSGCLGARTLAMYVKNGVAVGGNRVDSLPGTRAAWAALVTGRQRARLLRAWKTASEPCYSDTDSLVCKSFGGDSEGNDLCGRWMLEERFAEAWILGPKMYATLDRSGAIQTAHVKGIPKRLAAEAIRRFQEGGETSVEWDSVVTYREAAGSPALWIKRKRDPFVKARGSDARNRPKTS